MSRDLLEPLPAEERPPLFEALLSGQTMRAYALLDAGVDPANRAPAPPAGREAADHDPLLKLGAA